MEKLEILKKIYDYGETLSSEELNQIVSYLNSTIEAVNSIIDNNNGINAGHTEIRYKVSALQPNAPEIGSNGKTNGWSDTYAIADTANGEITWMTMSFINGDGLYGAWSTPVCITWGSVQGLQGPRGIMGLRGAFKSRVFKRQNTRPDAPVGGTYDDPIPEGWSDGVPNGNAIIWSSSCTFAGDGTSSGWSTPAPESDNTTLDIEFSPSLNQPLEPLGNVPFSNHEIEGWYDPNSSNFDNAGRMIWRAERKVSNGEYDGDWIITRIYGEKGERGDTGYSGGHYEFRYMNYAPTTDNPIPTKPTNGSAGTSGGWSSSQTTLTELEIKSGVVTWMTQCYLNGAGEYGTWTDPIRITGANGEDGNDGTEIEFVYTLNNTGTSPDAPPINQNDDWPRHLVDGNSVDNQTVNGITWYDNPQGVTENMMYEFVSNRTKVNGIWSAYSTPVLWSKWGEKGLDGDGVLYIYKLFSTELTSQQCIDNIPDKPFSKNEYGEWIPSGTGKNAGWYDDPVSPTVSQPYCYCSVIKEINGTWGSFEKLSLWARFSKDSTVPGPDGKGITYILTREGETETYWADNTVIGTNQYFSRNCYPSTPDMGTNCRIGDFFIVKGTASSGKFHQATYRCTSFETTTASGENYPRIFGDCISHIKDGDAGASISGKTGPMFYIAGIWNSNTQYTKNDYKCPVVMLASNNKYYYLKEASSLGQNPSSFTNIWGEADNFAAVFTQVLFSEFAKLGSFVINDDWMISQHGVEYDSSGNLTMVIGDNTTNYQNFKTSNPTTNLSGVVNFCPNLAIDAKTGRVYAQRMDVGGSSTFKGTVFANAGSFTGIVNATSLVAGDTSAMNIKTSSNKIEFCQGTNTIAYFEANGNGVQLHIWDSNGEEYIIDFTKWNAVNQGTFNNETWYLFGGTNTGPTPVTFSLNSSDNKYYYNANTSSGLVNGTYYIKSNARESAFLGIGGTETSPEIFAPYLRTVGNKKYAIALNNVSKYTKYTFTNGECTIASTEKYLYYTTAYPDSVTFNNDDIRSLTYKSTYLNPRTSSQSVDYRWTPFRGTEAYSNSIICAEATNSSTGYDTSPMVYDIIIPTVS